MINSGLKDKVIIILTKHGLNEQRMAKGMYSKEGGITADLTGKVPVIGMMINGKVQPEGYSNREIDEMQREVEIILSKSSLKSQSSSTEHAQKQPAGATATLENQTNLATEETKLGAGDIPLKIGKMAGLGTQKQEELKKGTTKATCPDCKTIFEISLDEARTLYDKYGGVYCQKCRDKPTENKHDETKHQETEKGKDGKVEEHKAGPEEPKVKEKIMDEKLPTPTNKQEANLPVKKTDAQIDEMIELAKAEKFLKGQGGSYTVSGKNRPDSAMVQKIANAENISCEILVAEQTKDYAHVVVRGHQGNNYIDAVVHHDFETEFQLQTMEIIKKNPQILDHYEGLIPVIKEGATIILSDKQVDAKYHLIHTLLTFKTFSLRDATTKAMQIVQSKLLNQDPRTKEEVAREQKERDMVEEKRNQKAR